MNNFFGNGWNAILNQLIPIICIVAALVAGLNGVTHWYAFLIIIPVLEVVYIVRSL